MAASPPATHSAPPRIRLREKRQTFILAVGKDESKRHVRPSPGRSGQQFRTEVGRAVVVGVEQDEYAARRR